MSLVICSNQAQDGESSNSVSEAFSFRNALSSTYKIKKNSQIALQSAKLNIAGNVVFNGNNSVFYQYFGKQLNLNGTTSPQIDDTTSFPLFVNLQDGVRVSEFSPNDFANNLQNKLNQYIYHPNLKEQITCEVLNNASGFDFDGYKITYDQVNTTSTNVPVDDFLQWYRKDGIYAGPTSNFFDYNGGVFQRNASLDEYEVCAGINTEFPLNLGSGTVEFNISHGNGNVNASGTEVEFMVGLSRFINNENEAFGDISPPYFVEAAEDDLGYLNELPFFDFCVGINRGGEIVCARSRYNDVGENTYLSEVDYWENASSSFSGNGARKDASEGKYTKIKITAEGERVKAEIYNDTTKSWQTITQYRAGEDADDMFGPVHQACWCLHPTICIGHSDNNASGKIEIADYQGIDITGYDPTKKYKGGWYETQELDGRLIDTCYEVEKRDWNNVNLAYNYAQVGTNASGGVDFSHALVLTESDVYKPSEGANARSLLGFNRSVVDTYSGSGSQAIFESVVKPSLINKMSLFIRVNNLGQNVVNALQGNKSKIIAHLTGLETETGIVSYEPNSLVWLDLDNPADINLTDFDLSINYINEQYARIVTGQSIIALYFREKPPSGM